MLLRGLQTRMLRSWRCQLPGTTSFSMHLTAADGQGPPQPMRCAAAALAVGVPLRGTLLVGGMLCASMTESMTETACGGRCRLVEHA